MKSGLVDKGVVAIVRVVEVVGGDPRVGRLAVFIRFRDGEQK